MWKYYFFLNKFVFFLILINFFIKLKLILKQYTYYKILKSNLKKVVLHWLKKCNKYISCKKYYVLQPQYWHSLIAQIGQSKNKCLGENSEKTFHVLQNTINNEIL